MNIKWIFLLVLNRITAQASYWASRITFPDQIPQLKKEILKKRYDRIEIF